LTLDCVPRPYRPRRHRPDPPVTPKAIQLSLGGRLRSPGRAWGRSATGIARAVALAAGAGGWIRERAAGFVLTLRSCASAGRVTQRSMREGGSIPIWRSRCVLRRSKDVRAALKRAREECAFDRCAQGVGPSRSCSLGRWRGGRLMRAITSSEGASMHSRFDFPAFIDAGPAGSVSGAGRCRWWWDTPLSRSSRLRRPGRRPTPSRRPSRLPGPTWWALRCTPISSASPSRVQAAPPVPLPLPVAPIRGGRVGSARS
jgi:hypothetical protein